MDNQAEQRVLAQAAAQDNAKAIDGTSIGYALSLIMDFGNGRQVTISGTLPLNASKADFDGYLDTLREATNRQQAFVIKRDREARMVASEHAVKSLKYSLEQYEKQEKEQLQIIDARPDKNQTLVKRNRDTVIQQGNVWKQQRNQMMLEEEGNIEVHKAIIAQCQREIGG